MNIEDIFTNDKQKNILINYVKDLVSYDYQTKEEYNKKFLELRKKYKFNPKKTDLLRTYRNLLETQQIKENSSFYKFSIKKIGKSSSGVSVITVLTSPEQEYTNSDGEKIKQSFSCGNSCSYCPNEPEEEFIVEVIEKNDKLKLIKVRSETNMNSTKVLTYLSLNDKKINVNECFGFKENTFTIKVENTISDLLLGQKIIGIKREQPRSYLSSEPAVLRANRNKFLAVEQFNDRADALVMCGHPVDKIEIIILGGTWDHYPKEYRYEFIRDIYYSSNIYKNGKPRKRRTLESEIKENELSETRIIGITIETRPDCITKRSIRMLRELNVTRVQLGVQHTDDLILHKIKRNCYLEDTKRATHLLKQNGYKVDWHLMPALPGSSYEKDKSMIDDLFKIESQEEIGSNYIRYKLKNPDLQSDQLKIYPCTTVDWTEIKEWYDKGEYKPYSEDEEKLIELIIHIKKLVFPWIRLNRIIRDIPNIYILGGNENVNLRQKVLKRMKEENSECKCIRCSEVKNREFNENNSNIFIDEYDGYLCKEYFISYRSKDRKILYGFIRLRINFTNDDLVFDELRDSGLVRELHVYGKLIKHNNESDESVQHMGIGKKLLREAERICLENNRTKLSIISGVGVREYYRKNGYHLEKTYMIKNLNKIDFIEILLFLLLIIFLISLMYDLLPV